MRGLVKRPPIVGIDFDNTIVSYDDVMHQSALKLGLISPEVPQNKKSIRDAIRSLNDGENKWCKLQAYIYGECMPQAKLIEGVKDFLVWCKENSIQVYVVSHKTQFAAADEKGIDLRLVARDWMQSQGLLKPQHGLSSSQVFFESTRAEKVARIAKLGCTHFIDDLEETFLEETFPAGTAKILYSIYPPSVADMALLSDWKNIYGHFSNTAQSGSGAR